MQHNQFGYWNLDRRFFYVWQSLFNNAFCPGSTGPSLAVMDDFGNLVPTTY